jgi:hypothetical protein
MPRAFTVFCTLPCCRFATRGNIALPEGTIAACG